MKIVSTVGMQMLTQVFGPQSWGTLANYNEQTCSTPDTGKLFHNMAIGIWLRCSNNLGTYSIPFHLYYHDQLLKQAVAIGAFTLEANTLLHSIVLVLIWLRQNQLFTN